MKKTWIMGIATVILVGTVFFVTQTHTTTEGPPEQTTISLAQITPKPYSQVPQMFGGSAGRHSAVVSKALREESAAFGGRERRQIAALSGLSIEELLDALAYMEYYIYPGFRYFQVGMNTVDDKGRLRCNLADQKMIMSSRAFRKCLHEICLLPKDEAAWWIENEIQETLPLYLDTLKKCESGLIPLSYSEREDGKPVLPGLRYKLLALLLIAGTCELIDAHETVCQVVQVALEEKIRISKMNLPPVQSMGRLTKGSLWNPVILCAGFYGTSPYQDLPQLDSFAQRYGVNEYVDYTAAQTAFDNDGPYLTVPDDDIIDMRYFENATDDDVLFLLAFDSFWMFM